MATKETVIAYWQAPRSLVKDSGIHPENQRALYFAGQAGYLGVIATAFAARRQIYGGISSALPEEVAAHRPTLERQGIELHAVAAPNAERATRTYLRHDLAAGAAAVKATLLGQARTLEPHQYDNSHEVWQNTGQLFIPRDNETIPLDLQQMIQDAILLDERSAVGA